MTGPAPLAARSAAPAWRRRLLVTAGVVVLLALAWTLGVGGWLPRFAQLRAEAAASAALGTPLKIERIEISPWTLDIRVIGTRLGPVDAPWLRLAEADAALALESIWQLAPVLRRLTLRAPQLELERLPDGRLNIAPMLDALARQPPAPPGSEPARFIVHDVRIEDGGVHFVDRIGGTEHRVTGLRVGVPYVSSLPAQANVDVESQIDAQVDDSRLHLHVRSQPFGAGLRSAAELRWQQIDVARLAATLAPVLPAPLPLKVGQGRIDLALQLAFERRAAPAAPSLHVGGSAMLSHWQAAVPAQGLQLAGERLALDGLDLRPLEQRATVGTLTLDAPAVDLDLAQLLAPTRAAAPLRRAAQAAAAVPPAPGGGQAAAQRDAWQWRIGRIAVDRARVHLRYPGWPSGQSLQAIRATAIDLDSAASQPAAFTLAFADAAGAHATVEGSVGIAARRADARVEVSGLQLSPWAAPWQAALPVRLLGGSVSLRAEAHGDAGGWSVRDGTLKLAQVQLAPAAPSSAARDAAGDRVVLAAAEADGVALRSADKQPFTATVASLRLDRLDVRAARSADGAIAWLPRPAVQRAPPTSPATPAPVWQLGELRCSACAFTLTDRGTDPVTSVALTRTTLMLRRLGSDPKQPAVFDVAADVGRGGHLSLRGSARLQPLALRSRVDLAAVELGLLQPYLDPYVNLTLVSAKASAAGELLLQGSASRTVASARWQGQLALADVRALDRLNAAEFLRLGRLSLDGADISWRPESAVADLGQVTLDAFYGRVIVNADGRINLRDIVKPVSGAQARSLTTPTTVPAPAAAASAPAAAASSAAPTPLRWRGIHLAGGEVDFTDNFVRPNYSARLTRVSGDISALAWDDPQPAQVRITGEVDDSAPLEISGTIHPLGARLHTDISAEARGIDMTRLSAYAARYAGYGIEKGTLTAKVHYRIDGGKLEAQNQLVLDQLVFGARVDSPDALKVPVLLAVALLKDRNGVIDVNLPISGSLDDPKFSLGGVIVRVIVNLVVKAVTAPFTLLAHAFGGDRQQLSFAAFEPGSAAVDAAVRPQLDTLAKALLERPGLRLEITGRADPARDAAALQHAYVERLLRQAKARATREPEDSVSISPAEREQWLEAAYREADLPDKPRNVLGLQKALPAAEMEARLLKSAPADPQALRALADARADHVKAYLAQTVAPERLLLTASHPDAEGITDGGPASRVGFALQ